MVKYLKYKDEKLPFRLSVYAISMTQAEVQSLENVEQLNFNSIEVLQPLVYYALESGHKAINKEFTLTKDDIFDIVEECFPQIVAMLPDFFAEIEKENKKKVITKKKT